MAGLNKIEEYLIELRIQYEEIQDGAFLITDSAKGLSNVVVAYEEPLVVVRVKVMEMPTAKREEFFEKLLTLNGSDLLHGAYGISGKDIILVDNLEYGTMDKGDLEATLDAMGLAIVQHYPILSGYRNK
jgi:hypothetical protein